MIFQIDDGTYHVSCEHDSDRLCCLVCQEQAAKKFIYNNISRDKWPLWLRDKFSDLTKEQITKEYEEYRNSSERTNSLLQRILHKLENNNLF